MRLYSDDTQMISKRGKNKEECYLPAAPRVTDVPFAICDQLLTITGFLSATYLDKFFLPFHMATKFALFLPG